MRRDDDPAREHWDRCSDGPDLPRPAPTQSDRLLRALVLAWDLDDEATFEQTLTIARQHLGVMGVCSKPPITRRES